MRVLEKKLSLYLTTVIRNMTTRKLGIRCWRLLRDGIRPQCMLMSENEVMMPSGLLFFNL